MASRLRRDGADSEDLEDGGSSGEETVSCSSEGGKSCSEALDPILEAFLEMQPRKVRRVRYSRVPRWTLTHHVRLALQMLIMFVLIANLFKLSIKTIGLQDYKIIPIFLTVALVLPTIVQTWCTPEHTFTAWVSTEVHVFCMWIAWEFKELNSSASAWCIQRYDICIQNELIKIAIIFAGCFGVTCFLYVLKFVTMGCTIYFRCCRRCAAMYWHLARRVRARPGMTTFSYLPGGWLNWHRAEFTYCGASDDHGRPHGFGIWCDTSFHGECLRGLWVHGRPAGCFTSRESGTGAQFQQRGVGYVTSRGDCQPKDISSAAMLPHKLDHLRYGLGQVEVSFAGGFFPFLPSVEHHTAESSLEALVKSLLPAHVETGMDTRLARRGSVKLEVVEEEDLSMWRSDDAVSSSLRSGELPVHYVEGNHIAYVTPEALSQACGLTLHTKAEALVFIHGYNCELSTALGRVAQTLALGNMSPHIVPFVFSYAGGGVFQYFSAKSHMKLYGDDLAAFLRDLSNHFEEVHILTHSCGAEFLFANWASIADCFQPARRQTCSAYSQWSGGSVRWIPQGQRATNGDSRLHLATLTLMNPDVLVERVVTLLPQMMQVAEHFTTYNDANDGALFWSGWLQRLVPRWYQERKWSEETQVFGKMLKSFWVDRGEHGIFLKGDLVEGVNTITRLPTAILGSELQTWPGEPHVPGDGSIEVINCSTIDQNVHNLRHNYYMLNTQMVEDVCELIGNRLTAPYRQRLCQVNANIFNFLSPPSYLKE